MKIRTQKVLKLGEHKIYIRNFGNIFEYLLIFSNEIYSAHIIVKKRFWWLGKYPKKVEDNICKILINMAETTIETIKQMKKDKLKENKK